MREKTRTIVCAVVLAWCMVLGSSSVAWAQFDDDIPETPEEKAAKQTTSDKSYHAGNFELTLGGSIGGLFYPELELGAELGILPITDGVVVSAGGVGRVGYCVLCLGAGFLSGGLLEARAWNVSAMGRAGVHLPVLGEMFGVPELDISAGLIGGPGYFQVQVRLDDGTDSAFITKQLLSFSIGPYAALRYMFNESLFVGFDYRLLYVFSEENDFVRINDQDYEVVYSDIVQAGAFYNAYVGIRF